MENKNVVYIGAGILAGLAIVFWLLPTPILRPLLYVLLFLGSLFLILLVLIQRGRGGGLAGALGGMGGYSAFGTRAGDIFTRITIVAASLWILGAMALARINVTGNRLWDNPGATPKAGSPALNPLPEGDTKPEDASGGLEPTGGDTAPDKSDESSTDPRDR